MKHDLPGLADHAQAGDGFFSGKLSAPAIDGRDPAAFEFAETILNGIKVVMHEAEEDSPDHEAETGEGDHGAGLEVACGALRL